MRSKDLKISVKVQNGEEVRKFSVKHYLPANITFSRFFEDLKAEILAIVNEIIRR